MSRNIYLLIILLLTAMVALSCQQNEKDNVLAQINDYSVTETHFVNAFKEYYYRTGKAITPNKSTKLSVLNARFDNYVLATYAEDEGIDETEEAFQKKGEFRRRVLNEEYLNQVLLNDIKVTEAELTEYFVRFNTTLRASHLYAPDKETADALYARLQNGETFNELAKEVFGTPYLANNGGDIGRFTTDEMDIAFEEAAFELTIGEISKPVPTAQGYSIIKLTDRFTKPILTRNEFANRKDQIQSYVYKKKKELATRNQLYTFRTNLLIDESRFDALWESMNDNYESAISKNPEFLNNISSDQELARYQDFVFTMSDFATEYRFTPMEQINAIEGKKKFRDFVIGTALRAYLLDGAVEHGLEEQPLVKESIDETFYVYLASEAVEHLKNSITNTDAELRKAFNENRERFYRPLEVSLSRIVVESEEIANEVIEKYNIGNSFKSLVNEYTILNEDLMTEGNLGFETLRKYGSQGTELAKLSVGEISKPFQYHANEYIVYRMDDRREGRSMNFEEAKEFVHAFLTQQKLKVLKERTIKDVKQKHNAIVNIEQLNKLTIQI